MAGPPKGSVVIQIDIFKYKTVVDSFCPDLLTASMAVPGSVGRTFKECPHDAYIAGDPVNNVLEFGVLIPSPTVNLPG